MIFSCVCPAGRTVIAVSCNGDVRPCAHNPISYGNILEKNLRDIWKKMDDWRSIQYIPTECKECAWLNRCNGGCRTSAKTISGKWDSKEIWATIPPKSYPPKETKQIELKPETHLQVNSEFSYRQEDETAFVVYNITDDIYFMVNKTYYDFIVKFKNYDKFIFGDLLKIHNVNNDNKFFYDVILFLIQMNVIKIIV